MQALLRQSRQQRKQQHIGITTAAAGATARQGQRQIQPEEYGVKDFEPHHPTPSAPVQSLARADQHQHLSKRAIDKTSLSVSGRIGCVVQEQEHVSHRGCTDDDFDLGCPPARGLQFNLLLHLAKQA